MSPPSPLRHPDVSNETIDAGVCRSCDQPIAYESDDPPAHEAVCLRAKPYCKNDAKVDWRARAVAAEKERDELEAALDAVLRATDIGKEKLITVMQRRYGREARQWQANHDLRKAERDAAIRERDAAIRERDAAIRERDTSRGAARAALLRGPLTSTQAALAEGAAESRVAQGDNAWSTLVRQRDVALARVRELEVQAARHSVIAERAVTPRLTKENDALSSVYSVAANLRTFPVLFDDHLALVDAVDACHQALHDLENREAKDPQAAPACPHCLAGEPSVWDDVLFHYAHPGGNGKLKMCHVPWRARCRRCSADVADAGVRFCGAACSQLHEMGAL